MSRSFTLLGARFAGKDWWTIGIHPAAMPVRVDSSSMGVMLCPVTLDGLYLGEGWPSDVDFRSCRPMGRAGRTALPATDGFEHVAFAVRSASPRIVSSLTVTYVGEDPFVEVLPPRHTDATVVFTPTSATVGARAYRVSGPSRPPGVVVTVRQSAKVVSRATPCDFPSEIVCVGDVTSGEPVTVTMQQSGRAGATALYISWQ